MADQPKAIVSTSIKSVLGWHIWTIVSVGGTITLLCLNFRQVYLARELGYPFGSGSTSADSANIVGALQIVAKVHELTIIASIVSITEQYILRDLLGDGLLLGLLGAGGAIINPSFLISKRFFLALKFGFRSINSSTPPLNNHDHRRTLKLLIVIFVACVIAGLAGPSSAVLMIPRLGWFLRLTDHHEPLPRSTIPTVLLGTAPGMVGPEGTMESNPFALPYYIVECGLQYWMDVSVTELRDRYLTLEQRSTHLFHDRFGLTYMQTLGSGDRSLGGGQKGGMKIRAETKFASQLDKTQGWLVETDEVGGDWTKLKVVGKTQAVDASTTCRAQTKIPCTVDSVISADSPFPDWCYRTVHTDPSRVGELRMGRNLLMSQDFIDEQPYPRVWVTEGPRIKENQHYSDSIEVLFEKPPGVQDSMMPNLTVCSFSAALVAATTTTFGEDNVSQDLEFHDYLFSSNGTKVRPRKFLFHENWLDRAYSYDSALWLADSIPNPAGIDTTLYTNGTLSDEFLYSFPTGSMVYPDNFTYPSRPGLVPQMNMFGKLGASLVRAVDSPNVDDAGRDIDSAYVAESTVGGILTYILSWSLPSFSQYSMPYNQIPENFRLEPPVSFRYPFNEEVFLSGYGYKLSSRTGYLGVAVLLLHATLALAASLWQVLTQRGIIRAWSTVPDYLCLGSSSSGVVEAYPNTCAGITGEHGLCSMIKVVETRRALSSPLAEPVSVPGSGTEPKLEVPSVGGSGEAGTVPHLEVVLVHGSGTVGTFPVDLRGGKRQYGFTEPKLKME